MQSAAANTMQGRILVVATNYPRWRGDATTPFVHHLAVDLQALGWQVTVLAPHAGGAARRETVDGVRVIRCPYFWPTKYQAICYQGGMLPNVRRHPWRLAQLPMLLAAMTVAARNLLAREPFDILHSHCLLPAGVVGGLARTSHVRHVITVHGSDIFALRQPPFLLAKRFALRRCDVVTANSSHTEAAVLELLAATGGRLVRIPMGATPPPVGTAAAAAEVRQRYHAKGPLLVTVGRLYPLKGVDDVITALPAILEHHPDARLLVVGEGPERPSLETLARTLGLADKVVFTGWVDADDIPAHLAAADVFVGASRQMPTGDQEAQGLTFAEAMLAGTPVVATRCGGIVDLVRHLETGILVPQREPAAIAAAVCRLMDDADLGQRLGAAGRRLAQEECSRPAAAVRFSALFAEMIGKKAAKR